MNKTSSMAVLLIASGAFLLSGCGTTAHYVEPGSSRLITTVGKIDIQDFAKAADAMTESLIEHYIDAGKLQSGVPSEPALMAINRIQNNTGQQIDTDLLVKKIRVLLNQNGKIQTSTAVGIHGPEDAMAADAKKMTEFLQDQKQSRMPDYTLSGKIIEVRARAGSTRQGSYVFQLSLSSSSGVAVWEEEKTITKQGSRPSVGF